MAGARQLANGYVATFPSRPPRWFFGLPAALQDATNCIMLGPGDPERVLGLYSSLSRDVFAPESFVWWQPGCGVFVTFGAVGGAVGCHEV